MRVDAPMPPFISANTKTSGSGAFIAPVSASGLPEMGVADPSRAYVDSAVVSLPVASTILTTIVRRSADEASRKVIVTRLGRAAGGIGKRSIATVHVPMSNEFVL